MQETGCALAGNSAPHYQPVGASAVALQCGRSLALTECCMCTINQGCTIAAEPDRLAVIMQALVVELVWLHCYWMAWLVVHSMCSGCCVATAGGAASVAMS